MKKTFNLSATCSRMKLHSPLNGHGDSLKQVRCFQWFFGNSRRSFADFFNYFNEMLLKESAVSIAIVANVCVAVKLDYFVILLAAALSPASDDVSSICESANVSITVTSQASGFPLDHRISRVVWSFTVVT